MNRYISTSLTLFLSLTILIFTSCGLESPEGDNVLGFSASVETGGTPLDDGELAVALRICYAYRSKRTQFLAQKLEGAFDFNYISRNCDQEVVDSKPLSTILKQLLPGGPLSYETVGFTDPYLREVQTDINGFLGDFCEQVFRGDNPLNVMEKDNEFYEFDFINNVYDTAQIKVGSNFNPNVNATIASRVYRFEVLTNQQSSGEYQGMVYKGTVFSKCDLNNLADGRYRSYEQTFIAP